MSWTWLFQTSSWWGVRWSWGKGISVKNAVVVLAFTTTRFQHWQPDRSFITSQNDPAPSKEDTTSTYWIKYLSTDGIQHVFVYWIQYWYVELKAI